MPEWIQWLNENWKLIIAPVAVFIAFVIGGRWLRRVVYDQYNRWATRTKWVGLALFVAKLHGPFLFWFVLLGAYVATKISVLTIEIAGVINTALLSLFVASWIWVAVSFSGAIVSLYLPKLRQYLARARAPQPPTGLAINGLRTVFIVIGLAILINIWKLPNVTGILILATALTIGILALREATTHLSKRFHFSYRTQRRLKSVGKVLLSIFVVTGIADIIRRIYLLASSGLDTTVSLVILFLEMGFVIWFIHILRSSNLRRARPSFRLVTALFITTVVILAFSGVQPLATYKDTSVTYLRTQGSKISEFVRVQSSQDDVAEIVGKVCPAIVRLEAGDYVGTGMIIDKTGYVLTCNHLIEDVQSVTVVLYDEGEYKAAVISRDEHRDLGIIKINATGVDFPCVTLGNSEQLKNGEEILVIGYSLGLEGETTVSQGIVSAFRSVEGVDLIQTDAAVNPGCSGGPLLNLNGQVVGIVTFKLAGEAVEGMGFAVSVNNAKAFINSTIQVNQPSTQQDGMTNRIESMEREVLALVNQKRASRGTPELDWDDALGKIADGHCQEMAEQGRLFHSPMSEPYAENCWGGSAGSAYYFDADDIVGCWMGSERHRTWLLCPHLKHIGVGIVVSNSEIYASWTFWRNETTDDDWWYDDGGSPPSWWY